MVPNSDRFASVDNPAKSTRNRLRISTAKKWTLWSTPCWTLGAGIQAFQWTLWSESNSKVQISSNSLVTIESTVARCISERHRISMAEVHQLILMHGIEEARR